MRVRLNSIVVDDQDKAVKFYTEVLGFVIKTDIPAGGARWITLVPPDEREGPELVLEPSGYDFATTTGRRFARRAFRTRRSRPTTCRQSTGISRRAVSSSPRRRTTPKAFRGWRFSTTPAATTS